MSNKRTLLTAIRMRNALSNPFNGKAGLPTSKTDFVYVAETYSKSLNRASGSDGTGLNSIRHEL